MLNTLMIMHFYQQIDKEALTIPAAFAL